MKGGDTKLVFCAILLANFTHSLTHPLALQLTHSSSFRCYNFPGQDLGQSDDPVCGMFPERVVSPPYVPDVVCTAANQSIRSLTHLGRTKDDSKVEEGLECCYHVLI